MEADTIPTQQPEANNNTVLETEVLTKVISEIQRLDVNARKKIMQTVATFFEISFENEPRLAVLSGTSSGPRLGAPRSTSFSEDRTMSPKDFILYKSPQTDVEQVACLAYYLTHFRDQKQFKAVDLSSLNTEAAQAKFSDATRSVANATFQSHFLVQTGKGYKQLSAIGELYVQALPDRDAARAVLQKDKNRKRAKKSTQETIKE